MVSHFSRKFTFRRGLVFLWIHALKQNVPMYQFKLLGNAPVCREKDMTDLTLLPHADLDFSVMLRTSGEEIHLSPQLSDFLPASFPLTEEFLEVLSCNRDSVGLSSVLLSYY